MSGERIAVKVVTFLTDRTDEPLQLQGYLAPGSLDEAKMRVGVAALELDVAREQQGIYSPEYIEAWHEFAAALAAVRALTKGETDG